MVGSDEQSGERVQAIGVVSDVVEYLSASSVFVYVPRPWEGSHDFVVMEAMAMGLPCILSDVPTVRESVRDQNTALLVPYGDVQALADALHSLLTDPDAAAELGHRARGYALAHFNVRQCVAEYEDVYRKVLG